MFSFSPPVARLKVPAKLKTAKSDKVAGGGEAEWPTVSPVVMLLIKRASAVSQ
jgi:hypothetical protein